jgi:hypothetical protein
MRRLRTAVGALAAIFVVLSISVPAAASAAVPVAHPQKLVFSSTSIAPVYIHFKPKSASGVQGGTVTVGAVVKNNGSFDFVATSCILWYRLGTSGAWTKAGVCLNPADFPFTFPAHSKTTFSASQTVAMNFPTGVYEWKIVAVGTYHGATEKSHAGKLKVTIT